MIGMENEMDNRQWRDFMDAAMGVPPGQVTVAAVRRRVVRRRIREATGVLAAVAVAVTGVTAAVRVYGVPPGPAAHHRRTGPTVYVAYAHGCLNFPCASNSHSSAAAVVIPISTATNTPGKPIKVGAGPGTVAGTGTMAFTPDGKTAYVLNTVGAVIPVSTATNRAGNPIHVGHSRLGGPAFIAITPDGKTAYVLPGAHSVIPVSTATNTAGRPIQFASGCRSQVHS